MTSTGHQIYYLLLVYVEVTIYDWMTHEYKKKSGKVHNFLRGGHNIMMFVARFRGVATLVLYPGTTDGVALLAKNCSERRDLPRSRRPDQYS